MMKIIRLAAEKSVLYSLEAGGFFFLKKKLDGIGSFLRSLRREESGMSRFREFRECIECK